MRSRSCPRSFASGWEFNKACNVGGFFYRTLYSWGLDTPGSYSLTVVFTLMAP